MEAHPYDPELVDPLAVIIMVERNDCEGTGSEFAFELNL